MNYVTMGVARKGGFRMSVWRNRMEVLVGEFDENILYAIEILLSWEGKTELVYDFPEEEWATVWEREIVLIKGFCRERKMC